MAAVLWDDEAGLINMKGRLYDPRVGRFLSPDPMVQAPFSSQSFNLYSYVLNNPLRYTDPSGFTAENTSSVTGTWLTADGEGAEICGSTNPGDCGAPIAISSGTSKPSSIAGGADQNGSVEPGYVESSCKYCVGDGRGLFALSDQQVGDLQSWLRETRWSYVPAVGLGTTSLNLMLSLMRGSTDDLASDAAQVAFSFVSAKVVGLAFKAAAPVVVSAARRGSQRVAGWAAAKGTGQIGAQAGAKFAPFNPTGGNLNCVNGVCSFLASIRDGTLNLNAAMSPVRENGGSIAKALGQIQREVGVRFGAPQLNKLVTGRSTQLFVVFRGSSAAVSDHVLVGIHKNGRSWLYDPQSAEKFKNLADFGSFTAYPLIFQ